MEYNSLAAVDLGSNSFHLAIGRVVDEQVYPLDSIKETVRLASGIGPDRQIDEAAQDRALKALGRFAERIVGMPREAVRAVGTNALRMARNAAPFLRRAEQALGFPIEVIPGREKARLIYLGVVHSLPLVPHNRLVIDVGGGSTEFIIGNKLRVKAMESLYMGCVSYTGRYFPGGRVDRKALRRAELAAREQLQPHVARFARVGWRETVGSSGTARSVAEILQKNGRAEHGITAAGLEWLRERLVDARDFRSLSLPGLREDRVPVIAGGVAVLSGIFAELEIDEMTVAGGALRDGVLWDLLGRVHHRDIREVTVEQFARRYHVDLAQSARVASLAEALRRQLAAANPGLDALAGYLEWAARLHEVGMSIAQGAYHKHSAYILANADMPGFSRRDQGWLSNLVLAQRGKLAKMRAAFDEDPRLATLAFCLRVAVILHRSRRNAPLPTPRAGASGREWRLAVDAAWLARNSLVDIALDHEKDEWKSVGWSLGLAALEAA